MKRRRKIKTLREYVVTWTIELGATSAVEAAELALEVQRDPDSLATVFEVADARDGASETIDLLEERVSAKEAR